MKKIIVSVLLLTNIYGASAQSLETGIKMVQYERYENAKKELSSINSALANFYTGLALIGQDKVEDAKNIFNKYPTDYVNQTGLVRVLFEQKNIETAKTLIKSIIDKNKKNLPILRFVADAITYTNGGDYNQAVDIYKKIIEKADNADIRIALGDAYRKQIGGGGEAMNNYEKAVELDSKNSLAYSRIGSLWYEAHNYNDALSNYTKAKDNDANNPLPYRDLANAYYWIGKYDLAKQNIERYIELSDQSLDDKKKYADILYLTKNYNLAITKMQELLSAGLEKPYMYRIMAYSQYEIKEYTNAKANIELFFTKEKDANKLIPLDYLYYGKILNQNGLPDEANQNFEKWEAMDTTKNKLEGFRSVAELYRSTKAYDKAGYWYGMACKKLSNATKTDYFWWGVMNYYGKQYIASDSAFVAMQAKYPNESLVYLWRGNNGSAIDQEAKNGNAVEFYSKWLSVKDSTAKKEDVMKANQYLALYYYNKNDVPNMKIHTDNILLIDPTNGFAKQLQQLSVKEKPKETIKPTGKKPAAKK